MEIISWFYHGVDFGSTCLISSGIVGAPHKFTDVLSKSTKESEHGENIKGRFFHIYVLLRLN
jgi:hypothetical protein